MRTERPSTPDPAVHAAQRSMAPAIEQLAAERARSCLERAGRERQARRLRALRRAARKERTAERRLIQAWRHAAELRTRLESPDH